MLSTRFLPLLAAVLCLHACTSSSGIEGLAPSSEITSSVPRPGAVVPAASKAEASAEAIAAAPAIEPPAAVGEVAEAIDAAANRSAAAPEPLALISTDKRKAVEEATAAVLVHPRKFRDAKPINFGKASPRQMAVHGVDVSRWQGEIDWEKLRSQGANFVYIKATDGGDHLDPMFKRNWKRSDAAGLKRGAYHFFYWCRTAGEQADWFIRNVPKVAGALPPVIDVEWNGESSCKRRPSPAKVREKMQVFMDKLEAHYGQRPVIYTAPDFYRDNLKGAFQDYPFWLRAVAQHPSKVYPGRKWVFWQYSGSGLSHGVSGRIDLNVFNGSEADWRRWLGRTTGSVEIASE